MSDQASTSTASRPSPPHQRRRSSFAELFANRSPFDPSSATSTFVTPGQASPRSPRPSQTYLQLAADNYGGVNGNSNTNNASSNSNGATSTANGPNQQQIPGAGGRRLSITTLGLSGSPTRASVASATSPFGALKRGQSISETDPPRRSYDVSRRSTDASESAVADDLLDGPPSSLPQNSPPYARRVSFGARAAYRDMRSSSISSAGSQLPSGTAGLGGGGGGGGLDRSTSSSSRDGTTSGLSDAASGFDRNGPAAASSAPSANSDASSAFSKVSTSPPSANSKEGFNWSENLRARAQRASISSGTGIAFSGGSLKMGGGGSQARAPSMSGAGGTSAPTGSVLSSAAAARAQAAPAAPTHHQAPDHFQERILKGDFYMD